MSHPSRSRWRGLLPLALAPIITVTVTAYGRVQSSLDPAGPDSARISRLWWLMLAVCTAVFLLVLGFLLHGVYRAWRREAAATDDQSKRRMTRAVTAATAATTLILFVLLVASVMTGRAISTKPDSDVIDVEVVGHQWWWEFTYKDAAASQQVSSANELHVPVGKTVVLKLTSRDVIHSFWAPNLQGKKDLIPGHFIIFPLRADREGTFRGQCAEFCGPQHAHMAFTVIAEPEDRFLAWLDAQRQPARPPADPLVARGQQVFLSKPCVMCHTVRGTPAGSRVGPELTHIATRPTIAAGTLEMNRGNLAGWVVDAQSIKPGSRMPPNSLTSEELDALLAYLESLK
ncbi:MAG TPA: cytochrome c oxidase subunit II [Blastocatellia bacterium]|nr:cytochrome c oxidase subunit II [Blastocatellia bacterium]